MADFIVLGTDTDAGKTTFSLLWMTAYSEEYAYWKPLETGDSDSEQIRLSVPNATVLPPYRHFVEAVAPSLAAKRLGEEIPSAGELVRSKPDCDKPLLIETFGSPLSPLNATELQLAFIQRLKCPAILVARSSVGAVGRVLSSLKSVEGLAVQAVVLMGTRDPYAEQEILKHSQLPVYSVRFPVNRSREMLLREVAEQVAVFEAIRLSLMPSVPVTTEEWNRRDQKSLWHPYTSLLDPDPPLMVVGAHDEFLELADGSEIIDGISSWWTILHGHRPTWLMEAIRQATHELDHVIFGGATHPAAIECAELLLETAPWESGGRVFFSDNGSTAVEVALKMAYQWWSHREEPQRTLFIGFDGAYHGDTFGAMSISRDETFFGRFEPLLFQAIRIPIDPNRLEETLREHRGKVAAMIIEPLIQGAGGMLMHSTDTLRQLFEVAKKHGVLFIADEVMTGIRTGSFWAHTQAGIAPDLICYSKTLTGGVLPLSATLVQPEIVRGFESADRTQTFFHGHSFTANPIACAAAVTNLRYLKLGQWQQEAKRIATFWEGLKDRLSLLPNVREVRTKGTILAVELDYQGGYLADVGRQLRRKCLSEKVLLRPLGNVLYSMPPLCTSNASLEQIGNAMAQAIRFSC
jgi:adenosylmethionine-8-amino-7-oxononanoate aminotransferase